MNNILKHLLLPFTTLLWYFICHYIPYLVFIGLAYIFSLGWLSFIFFYLVLVGLVYGMVSIPSFLNYYLIKKLYNLSWIAVIFHSLAGSLGIFSYLKIYYYSDSTSLSIFWDMSWLRTILLGIPACGVIIGMVWSLGISPVFFKLSKIKS